MLKYFWRHSSKIVTGVKSSRDSLIFLKQSECESLFVIFFVYSGVFFSHAGSELHNFLFLAFAGFFLLSTAREELTISIAVSINVIFSFYYFVRYFDM